MLWFWRDSRSYHYQCIRPKKKSRCVSTNMAKKLGLVGRNLFLFCVIFIWLFEGKLFFGCLISTILL